ncbi:hypothetical protein [Pseudogemmobacter sonorensis]|uniref:hypothetical protein n=1 Tax=Pseudogemmobacter sonorensis TaxID=2989681 RepID=UPI00369292CA
MAWTWMEAEDGIPAVLLRGLPMTYLLPAEGEARLRKAGIRLFVPLRAPAMATAACIPT